MIRLSMYMAQDALAGFMPIPEIVDGDQRYRGLRLGAAGAGTMGLMEAAGETRLVGGRDRIRLPGTSLTDAHDALMDALTAWSDWDARLQAAAAEGTLQDLVDIAFELFDEPIFITDARDRISAITPHPRGSVNDEWDHILEHGSMPAGRLVGIYRDQLFRSAGGRDGAPFIFNPPGMSHRGINMRFLDPASGDWQGVAVIIEHKSAITVGRLHLSESLYAAIAKSLRLHPAAAAAQAEAALLDELLAGGAVSVERAQLLQARLFPDTAQFLIAVLRPDGARPAQHAMPMIERAFPGARCIKKERGLVALFPDCPEALTKLQTIAAQTDARIGLSRPFSDWARIAEYGSQARTALETGRERVNELSASSVNALCAQILSDRLSALALAHPALAILADYDARHGSALLNTLQAYLMHERNLIKTANALYIHRNSLVYRVRRITELTGLNLDDPDQRLYLLYSFAPAFLL